MRFRDLRVGQAFEFANSPSGCEPGPWVKDSARKYSKDTTPFGTNDQADEHQKWHGLQCQVGSINVEVEVTESDADLIAAAPARLEHLRSLLNGDECAPCIHCDVCGGPRQFLGELGDLRHYRCRNCGLDSSEEFEVDA